jgi:pimeloyl-ACP methyl ester carboxylesterase
MTRCGEFSDSQLDFFTEASRRVGDIVTTHAARGIVRFLLTGHSIGAALAMLIGATATPPLPAFGFAVGAWRTAFVNATLNTTGDADLALKWSTSIDNIADPVPAAAWRSGEWLGQICSYADPNTTSVAVSIRISCLACKTGVLDLPGNSSQPSVPITADQQALYCDACMMGNHGLRTYLHLISSGQSGGCISVGVDGAMSA